MTVYMESHSHTAQSNGFDRSPTDDRLRVILIVEDDDDSRQMLKFLLETWKYRVIEATDGLEAFAIAEKFRPDLILMDAKLPNSDGFETTRRIRESKYINRIPIVFLSGCARRNLPPRRPKGWC